jgi:hypothetical protein
MQIIAELPVKVVVIPVVPVLPPPPVPVPLPMLIVPELPVQALGHGSPQLSRQVALTQYAGSHCDELLELAIVPMVLPPHAATAPAARVARARARVGARNLMRPSRASPGPRFLASKEPFTRLPGTAGWHI